MKILFRKYFLLIYMMACLAGGAFLAFNQFGLLAKMKMKGRLARLEEKLSVIKRDIQMKKRQMASQEIPEVLVRRHGYATADETVFHFIRKAPPTPQDASVMEEKPVSFSPEISGLWRPLGSLIKRDGLTPGLLLAVLTAAAGLALFARKNLIRQEGTPAEKYNG